MSERPRRWMDSGPAVHAEPKRPSFDSARWDDAGNVYVTRGGTETLAGTLAEGESLDLGGAVVSRYRDGGWSIGESA